MVAVWKPVLVPAAFSVQRPFQLRMAIVSASRGDEATLLNQMLPAGPWQVQLIPEIGPRIVMWRYASSLEADMSGADTRSMGGLSAGTISNSNSGYCRGRAYTAVPIRTRNIRRLRTPSF